MKLVLPSTVFDKQGGISRYVCELCDQLKKDNDVTVVTSKVEYETGGVRFVEAKKIGSPISARVASFAVSAAKKINALRREGVDLVNSQGAECYNSDVVTLQSVQAAAVRQFSQERGVGYRVLKAFEPRNRVVLAIEGKNLKDPEKRLIAISETVKQEILDNYKGEPERVRVIHSGVNLDEFNPENRGVFLKDIRGRHGFSVEDRVLLFVGWEFKRKGLEYVIRALPGLAKDVKLLVVGKAGPGPYVRLAEKLGVSDRVCFAGHQSHVEKYFAAADLFVFPTAYEPFGLVITEAMASGVPAVTYKGAGAAELIEDGVDGMLLEDAHSQKEVLEKVAHILDNDLSKKMGANARTKAERYGWESVREKTLDFYRQILEEKGSA